MTITREQAGRLLKAHSWSFTSLTEYNPKTSTWVLGTSFNDIFGIHEVYSLSQIKRWLGY